MSERNLLDFVHFSCQMSSITNDLSTDPRIGGGWPGSPVAGETQMPVAELSSGSKLDQ